MGLWQLRCEGVHFVFLGDTGHSDPPQYAVAKGMQQYCGKKKCDFALLLGDSFYPKGVASADDPLWKSAFEVPYNPLKILFHVVLGNHDYEGNVGAQIEYGKKNPLWSLPARNYSFSEGNVQVFVIDSTQWDSVQRDWLKKEIGESKARWRIVAAHHPIFSYGKHGNTENLVKELRPLLLGKANFFLCGHDHDKQVLKDPQDGDLHYVVSGGGSEVRPTQGGPLSLFSASTIGFSSLELDETKAVLKMLSSEGTPEWEQIFPFRRGTAW